MSPCKGSVPSASYTFVGRLGSASKDAPEVWLEQKHKIAALQFIASTHRLEFENRRKVEWRVVILCLTFYVLAVALKFKEGVKIPLSARPLLIVAFLLVAAVTVIFSFFIHLAHAANKGIAERAESAIQSIINGITDEPIHLFGKSGGSSSGIYGWLCQSAMVVVFALTSIVLFWD